MCVYVCCCCFCLVAKSCPALCDPMDYSTVGSSLHGIFQARILERFALSYSKVAGAQACPILCGPMDYSLLGYYLHGIFQTRTLEWGAIAFSKSIYVCLCLLLFLAISRQIVLISPNCFSCCF